MFSKVMGSVKEQDQLFAEEILMKPLVKTLFQ